MKEKHWNIRGKTLDEVVAISATALDEILEERLADFGIDMADRRALHEDDVADELVRQRAEYAVWRTEQLAKLKQWLQRGGEVQH